MSSSPSRYQREIRLHTRHVVELHGEGLADAVATMSPEQFPCACVRAMDHGERALHAAAYLLTPRPQPHTRARIHRRDPIDAGQHRT